MTHQIEWQWGMAIGMVHFAPLPGSPHYRGAALEEIRDRAAADRDALLAAGFDTISFSNEGDRPYLTAAPAQTLAIMTRLVTELAADLPVPFGCGVLIDPFATFALAQAVGASFVRVSLGVTTGVFGWEVRDSGSLCRYRQQLGAEGIDMLLNVSPHFASSLDTRDSVDVVRSYVFMVEPEAIQIHGAGAGRPPSIDDVRSVKAAVPGVPVLTASGTSAETVAGYLEVCDGVVVGSSLKEGANIWNPVDPARAREYMRAVRTARGW